MIWNNSLIFRERILNDLNLKYVLASIGVAIAIIAVLTITSFSSSETVSISKESENVSSPEDLEVSVPEGIMVTNGQKHIVPLEKIKSGGPPKDGIPSIDNPKFVPVSESQFVPDTTFVIGLDINGEKRAYPLFIMVWHEIVNDRVGGVPVAVTYCPLCFTNQVFERVIDGKEVEFGTSGKLYNSNLVMYDRLTDSYWSQALGVAITGELTGYELKRIPFDVISWADWKTLHPDTLVLTTETGHIRSYGVDPYGDYYTDPRILFPVEHEDDRMHPKELILGFHESDVYKAYKQDDVESAIVINDIFNNKPMMLVSLFSGDSRAFDRTVNDKVLTFDFVDNVIIDLESKSKWNYDGVAISGSMEGIQLVRLPFNPGFWFQWVAFHPDTEVYESS
ncbi:MAG: hypothetical protein NPMRd3_170015 [Nitrosopumilales archaeon]|nr:MAG: hypothetical protein NPMRd3_170015 [Nitrosopumilales archaeon]